MKLTDEEIKETPLKDEDSQAEVKEEKKESKKERKDKYKEPITKLEEDKKKLEEVYKNLKNEDLKAYAELEDTKKRLKEEAIKDRKYASQKVVGELINPVDRLQMIVNMPAPSPEVQNYVIGFQMITNQLVDIFKAEGLAPIVANVGDEFDPRVMQVFDTAYAEDKKENTILATKQAGYMYKDRVLRPVMVLVNKKIEEKKEEAKAESEENIVS
jgi:molecular chaperone GrpE